MWPFRKTLGTMTLADARRETEGLGIRDSLGPDVSAEVRDKAFKKLDKFQKRVWTDHLNALDPEERRDIENGTHPSQCHSRGEDAKVYAEALYGELKEYPFIESVDIGYYHCDIMVLTVSVKPGSDEDEVQRSLPYLYHGFQIKWRYAKEEE